jgi:hypothetical protein
MVRQVPLLGPYHETAVAQVTVVARLRDVRQLVGQDSAAPARDPANCRECCYGSF